MGSLPHVKPSAVDNKEFVSWNCGVRVPDGATQVFHRQHLLHKRLHGYRYFRIHFFSPILCGVYDDVKVRSPWFWSLCVSRVRSPSWMDRPKTGVEESTVTGG